MAVGDITLFNETKASMLDGGWGSNDLIKVALITSAVVPTTTQVTPSLSDFTEVAAGGTYTTGGSDLSAWSTMISQSVGTVTFADDDASVAWLQNGSNPTNARYGIIYNSVANQAIAYIDLGQDVDLSAGDLTLSWNVNGIFTIA
jgi:hypothetical protein